MTEAYPLEFLDRMKLMLGDEYKEFQRLMHHPYYRGIRVNTLKCSSEVLEGTLDFKLKASPFSPYGFYIPNNINGIGNHPLHHAGAFYVQEPSASCAVTVLNPQKGDRVLDLCAAPGGKSTQIGAALQGEGLLWCNEIVKNRALILLSNIERMGIKNAVVSSCNPHTLCGGLTGFFDKILVDAPCSGEGMFRKDEAARQEWSMEHTRSCMERQLAILDSAKQALKNGGILVYSTCTFSPYENEKVIERFLAENQDFTLEDSGVSFGRQAMEKARRIYPMDGGEGHFVAKLMKHGDCGCTPATPYIPPQGKQEKEAVKLTENLLDSIYNDSPFTDRYAIVKDKVLALPHELPSIKGLGVLRCGVLLGEVKKNRIEPCHSMFMASMPQQARCVADLDVDGDSIRRFLHGEEIAVDTTVKGYTAVAVKGIITGFGKVSGGILKNKYPKGLRTVK
ncbi:MAG TPA: hypothetical protein GX401_01005 [Clostridiales bacterium]|nr:hypothetical protein [Clostridiales bacterium]